MALYPKSRTKAHSRIAKVRSNKPAEILGIQNAAMAIGSTSTQQIRKTTESMTSFSLLPKGVAKELRYARRSAADPQTRPIASMKLLRLSLGVLRIAAFLFRAASKGTVH
jgi:hypothetical protein